MPDPIRCFIGCSLTAELTRHIREIMDHLRGEEASVRWINPSSAHITLKFLGSASAEQLDEIRDILRAVASQTPAFAIQLHGLGAFPSVSSPNIIWVGFQDTTGSCARVAGILEDECLSAGFSRENRPFAGHITIGRVKSPLKSQQFKSLLSAALVRPLSQTVTGIHIYKSTLSSQGSVYEIVETFPFKT